MRTIEHWASSPALVSDFKWVHWMPILCVWALLCHGRLELGKAPVQSLHSRSLNRVNCSIAEEVWHNLTKFIACVSHSSQQVKPYRDQGMQTPLSRTTLSVLSWLLLWFTPAGDKMAAMTFTNPLLRPEDSHLPEPPCIISAYGLQARSRCLSLPTWKEDSGILGEQLECRVTVSVFVTQ